DSTVATTETRRVLRHQPRVDALVNSASAAAWSRGLRHRRLPDASATRGQMDYIIAGRSEVAISARASSRRDGDAPATIPSMTTAFKLRRAQWRPCCRLNGSRSPATAWPRLWPPEFAPAIRPALMKPMTNSWLWLSSWACHYIVACTNNPAYGRPSLSGYAEKLAGAFVRLAERRSLKGGGGAPGPRSVHIDAANGVGAGALAQLAPLLGEHTAPGYALPGGPGPAVRAAGQRWASFDGDADRIIYFYCDSEGQFQTAYANAESTRYLAEQLGVAVACVPTGVKHLHKRGKDFDIGVYFEANVRARLARKLKRLENCRLVMDLINETSLCCSQWSTRWPRRAGRAAEWNACYTDLPRQLKVSVANRSAAVTTTDAERRCVLPEGLQPVIDDLVAATQAWRAFVRPSGTEDVVRVYAEGATRELATSWRCRWRRRCTGWLPGWGRCPSIE
uniref:PGM_PMM_IV domain-containing protein n=1 Tax=Macrostomum lignano TaxID=282301 RepID=A0A1I8F464_9PLAT